MRIHFINQLLLIFLAVAIALKVLNQIWRKFKSFSLFGSQHDDLQSDSQLKCLSNLAQLNLASSTNRLSSFTSAYKPLYRKSKDSKGLEKEEPNYYLPEPHITSRLYQAHTNLNHAFDNRTIQPDAASRLTNYSNFNSYNRSSQNHQDDMNLPYGSNAHNEKGGYGLNNNNNYNNTSFSFSNSKANYPQYKYGTPSQIFNYQHPNEIQSKFQNLTYRKENQNPQKAMKLPNFTDKIFANVPKGNTQQPQPTENQPAQSQKEPATLQPPAGANQSKPNQQSRKNSKAQHNQQQGQTKHFGPIEEERLESQTDNDEDGQKFQRNKLMVRKPNNEPQLDPANQQCVLGSNMTMAKNIQNQLASLITAMGIAGNPKHCSLNSDHLINLTIQDKNNEVKQAGFIKKEQYFFGKDQVPQSQNPQLKLKQN